MSASIRLPVERSYFRSRAPTSASSFATCCESAGLDNLWEIVGPATRATWCARPTFVPHPRIAEHARAKGLQTVETSGGDAGMLRGLLEWFATHSTPTH